MTARLPTLYVDVLPITYDGLPEPERFLAFCREVASIANQNPLFKHYPVTFTSREDLSIYWPALVRGIIPPHNTRYNAMDGWLTVAESVRARSELLFTIKPVDPEALLRFPGLEKRYRILVAVVPCSVRTTPENWAQEEHFNTHGDIFVDPHAKAFTLVYHHTLLAQDGSEIERAFRDLDSKSFGHELARHVAEDCMGVEDVLSEVVRLEFGYETKSQPQKPEILERTRVLYLGGSDCSHLALKRSILLFDDLHFHDHPSIRVGNWGTIGRPSSLRQLSYPISREGVPLLVHQADRGEFPNLAVGTASADLEDPEFSRVFAEAFVADASFRRLFIQDEAMYPGLDRSRTFSGAEVAVAFEQLGVTLGGRKYDLQDLENWGACTDPSDEPSLRRTFGTLLVNASLELSLCCYLAQDCNLVLLAEHPAYQRLLQVRYNRERGESKQLSLMPSLPVLAVRTLDAIIPPMVLEKATLGDVIRFRKEMRPAYERFRHYLVKLNSTLEKESWTPEIEAEIESLMRTEVRPATQAFEDDCKGIVEKVKNDLSKEALGAVALAAASTAGGDGFMLKLLTEVTWTQLLLAGCGLGARGLMKVRDVDQAKKDLRRANALSYLLDFRKRVDG